MTAIASVKGSTRVQTLVRSLSHPVKPKAPGPAVAIERRRDPEFMALLESLEII